MHDPDHGSSVTPSPPAAVARSEFVTVVAWIYLVYAAMATFFAAQQILSFKLGFNGVVDAFFPGGPASSRNGWFDTIANFGIEFLVAVIPTSTLLASIFLLRRKRWARKLFIGLLYVVSAFLVLGGLYLLYVFIQIYFLPQGTPQGAPNDALDSRFLKMTMAMQIAQLRIEVGGDALFVFIIVGLKMWIVRRLRSPVVLQEFGVQP